MKVVCVPWTELSGACSSRTDLEGTVLSEMSRTLRCGGFWEGQTCCEGEQKAGGGDGGRESWKGAHCHPRMRQA